MLLGGDKSHTAYSRVELWYNGSPLEPDMPATDGGVTGTRDLVRRTLDVTFTEHNPLARKALWAALCKPGMQLKAFRGIRYLDGTVNESPLGVFVTRAPSLNASSGTISMPGCPDLMRRVIDARFETPRSSSTGFTFAQQIQSLVGQAVPRLTFRDDIHSGAVVPAAVWERDRGAAVVQLAEAAGGEAWFDPTGTLVLGKPATFADPAAWKVNDQNGGIVTADVAVDWDSTFNIVVVAGENPVQVPVYGSARDNNPASVTYWLGPMGSKPRFYDSPLLTTSAACIAAATTILLRTIGARKSITLTTVANTDLDVASRLDVTLAGQSIHERHIVDTFNLPLFSAGMSLTTRAVDAVEVLGG